jgi:putative DNA methylase
MTTPKIVAPKKLIEVALPLDDINKAAAREKAIRHGHPSTLHLWWARRPLAVARAVLFAQLVNDPSWKYTGDELKKPQVRSAVTRRRNELFRLISELVKWESTTNQEVLSRARMEIVSSWKETCDANKGHPDAGTLFDPRNLPAFHDPFAGGGALPIEAQRLGLEAHATDLNPVAVLINKAMIEIPQRFAGRPPVGPVPKAEKQTKAKATENWSGARGLAEDVRRYGAWIRSQAEKRIGHLYPEVTVTAEMVRDRKDLKPYEGQRLTVIAWLWARTVKSPNPAFADQAVPLISSYMLSTKEGREAHLEPVVRGNSYDFRVRLGPPAGGASARTGTKASRGANFRCILSGAAIGPDYVREEAKAGRVGARLIAMVAEGRGQRVFLAPTEDAARAAAAAEPSWRPDTKFFPGALGFRIGNYGFETWGDVFSSRQLVALTTFSDLVGEAREQVERAAIAAGGTLGAALSAGGTDARAYADAVAIYLAFGVSRSSDYWSNLCVWRSDPKNLGIGHVFSQQTVEMVWDFAEANPFSDSSGNWSLNVEWIVKVLAQAECRSGGDAQQLDARSVGAVPNRIFSTDPPYFDNIGYADLSDFFYVWLRRALKDLLPTLFATLATPKSDELVATPGRHGTRAEANSMFLSGMTQVVERLAQRSHPAFPTTIYYAFKQSETDDDDGVVNTGWESFLSAAMAGGMSICGTWPVRTELGNRTRGRGSNALASSIVLVCRPRAAQDEVSRRDFLRELASKMLPALRDMTSDPAAAVAPVDLAQAAIGPGIGLYSSHKTVLEADGSPMSVHNALVHINKAIDEYFAHAEGDLDADTRFCIGWFEQFGFEAGEFGQADVLARAKGTSVEGVKEAGVIEAGKGKVRLLAIKELPKKWDPTTDTRTPIWEALHHMCRALAESEGDAGALLAKMPQKQDAIRQLAYRLYTLCAERKGKAELGRPYNDLITSWPAIVEASAKVGHVGTQLGLL